MCIFSLECINAAEIRMLRMRFSHFYVFVRVFLLRLLLGCAYYILSA